MHLQRTRNKAKSLTSTILGMTRKCLTGLLTKQRKGEEVGRMSTVSGVSVLAVSSDGGYVNVKETQALDLPT